MKILKLFILVLAFSLADISLSYSQPPNGGGNGPGNPGGGQGDPPCFPPPCVPIDGGLSWLLVAGTIYGGKKVFDLNKIKEENNID